MSKRSRERRLIQETHRKATARESRARMVGVALTEEQNHTLRALSPNLYPEHDIGTKNVRYADGSVRSVKTHKVTDTAGVSFYTFDSTTRLS